VPMAQMPAHLQGAGQQAHVHQHRPGVPRGARGLHPDSKAAEPVPAHRARHANAQRRHRVPTTSTGRRKATASSPRTGHQHFCVGRFDGDRRKRRPEEAAARPREIYRGMHVIARAGVRHVETPWTHLRCSRADCGRTARYKRTQIASGL
jgi:hypothetical protein